MIPSKRESQLGTAVLKPHPLLFTFHPGEASGSAKGNSFELKFKKIFFNFYNEFLGTVRAFGFPFTDVVSVPF